MGPRGDAIAQLDWCVGEILATLDRRGLANDTLIIFSSDNGPVVDDGYREDAVEKLGSHRPPDHYAGESTTRVSKEERACRSWCVGRRESRPGVSAALVCQIDFVASSVRARWSQTRRMATRRIVLTCSPHYWDHRRTGRDHLVEHAGVLALRQGPWKLIEPGRGPAVLANTNTETGQASRARLYNLDHDLPETNDLTKQQADRVQQMHALLESIRGGSK